MRTSTLLVTFGSVLCSSVWAQAPCHEWSRSFATDAPLGEVRCHIAYDDGSGMKLYVGGRFEIAGSSTAFDVARFDGSRWTPVGAGLNFPGQLGGVVNALQVFDDGSGPALYAAGYVSQSGGQPMTSVARWDGSQWSPVGGQFDDEVRALCVFDDGSGPALYAAGLFVTAGPLVANHIARLSGGSWTDVGGGTTGPTADAGNLFCLAVHDDGSGPALYAGGVFASAGGVAAANLARWNGSVWSAVGGGTAFFQGVTALLSDGSGIGSHLYVAGTAGTATVRVQAWDGSAWTDLAGSNPLPSAVRSLARFDAGSGARIYAGGTNYLRVFDGTTWSTPPAPPISSVQVLAVHDLGDGPALYASEGSFQIGSTLARFRSDHWDRVGELEQPLQLGARLLVAFDDGSGPALYTDSAQRWNGRAWQSVASPLPSGHSVRSLAVCDLGGGARLCLGTSAANGGLVREYDGASWTNVGTFFNNGVQALASANVGASARTFAGGRFTSPGNRVAEWNGSAWVALGVGVDAEVQSLAFFDDGGGLALYAGGRFTHAGGVSADHIAKWDGANWSPLGAGVTGTGLVTVSALAVFDDGTGPALYAAGFFNSAGGNPAANVARWDGSAWTPLGLGIPQVPLPIGALFVHDDGSGPALFVGGSFARAGALDAANIAKWQAGAWHKLGRGVDERVDSLATFDDGSGGGPSLFLGGEFERAGGNVSLHIAEWSQCTSWAQPFCSGDGSAGACPCGNSGAPGHGCASSNFASGAELQGKGSSHLSNDTLQLSATNLSGPTCIFFQGDRFDDVTPFGDGLRCTGGTLRRMSTKTIVAGSASYPQSGDLPISVVGHVPAGGGASFVQVYYRDANVGFCTSATSNATNAVAIRYVP